MTVSHQDVLASIEAIEKARDAWLADDNPALFVEFRNQMVRVLDDRIEKAANELFELCATTDVENSAAQELILAVDEFEDSLVEYVNRQTIAPEAVHPGGGDELWRAFAWLLKAKPGWQRRKPTPIPMALAQGVRHVQICKDWGLYDDTGEVDLAALQLEITEPGSVIDVGTWQHPKDIEHDQEVAKKWADRCERLEERNAKMAAIKKPGPKVVPESLDELIQTVNWQQVCKMKDVTEEEVRARAAELGLPVIEPGMAAPPRTAREASLEREQKAQAKVQERIEVNTYEDLGQERDLRIRLMAEDGHSPLRIFATIKAAFPDLTLTQVAQIIKAGEPEPAQKPKRPAKKKVPAKS